MTLTVRTTTIAPDLRFGLVEALAHPGRTISIGGATMSAAGCLPTTPDIPRYLRYADRGSIVVVHGLQSRSELDDCLASEISGLGESGTRGHLGQVGIVLAAVDRAFRESGLWRGNVYLASAGALAAVVRLCSGAADDACDLEAVVRELAALELAYLFPVAGKFRSGTYDGQVQFRLNGWGRALSGRLSAEPTGAALANAYVRVIGDHLDTHRACYSALLSGLDVGHQEYGTDLLAQALALPIPVLV